MTGVIDSRKRRRLMLAALLGTAAMAAGAGSAPVPANAAEASQRQFNIPAQALADALVLFGQQSGLQVSAHGDLVRGLSSPGVTGALAPAEALSRLLAGTGLTFRLSGNTAILERAPQAAAGSIQLGPVRVEGEGRRPSGIALGISDDPTVTEGTGSYTTRATNTSTRLSLSPRETPQTVTIVTRQKIDDFGMTNVDDVLRSTSGVYVYPRGSNGAAYYARGFELQSQYDGIPNPIGIGEGNQNPSPDSAFLDRVEILHGASGLLSGAGEPGGTINLLRKRPTQEFQARAEALVGSWEKRRLVGDISGTLAGSGALRARAVAVWDDADSFIDYVFDKKQGFYGIVEADLSRDTMVSAAIQFQENDARINNGVPMGPDGADLGLKRSSYFGNARSRHKKEYALYTLKVEQNLASDWLLTVAYTHAKTKLRIRNGNFMVGGPLNVVTGDGYSITQHNTLDRDASSDSLEVYARGSLHLFGRKHELVIGGSGTQSSDWVFNSGNIQTPINIYDFDPLTLPIVPVTDMFPPTDSGVRQRGFYAAARLNPFDPLKIIIGSRVSWYRYKEDGVRILDESAVVSPYMGMVLDITDKFSIYASYSDIFKAQSERDRTGSVLTPIVGKNMEVGVKGELLDGRLNISAAIFRLEQDNLPLIDEDFGNDQANICRGYCYIAQDKVVSQGVDIGLNGEVTPGWNLSVGYTYVDSEYDSGPQKGDPYGTNRPKHLMRVHTAFAIPGSRWTLGGNLNAQSRFYNAQGVEQGSYAIAGLMARYKFDDNTDIRVVMDNIFDKRYFASAYGLRYTPFGTPRNFSVTLGHSF